MCDKPRFIYAYNSEDISPRAYLEEELLALMGNHPPERQAQFKIFELVPVKLETKLSFVRK